MPAAAEKLDCYSKQTFSCSGCGSCCNSLEVTITEAERLAIEKFCLSPPVDLTKAFVPLRPRLWNIAKTEEGRCVFMALSGRCRLHCEGGVELKPLACRLYPFTVHNWKDNHISVDCRYYCPAVGDLCGQPLSRHENHFRTMAAMLKNREKPVTVKYSSSNSAELESIRHVNAAFCRLLNTPEQPLTQRLYTAARIMDFHSRPDMRQAIANADASFVNDAVQFAAKAHDTLRAEFDQAAPLTLDNRLKLRLAVSNFFRDDSGQTSWQHRLRRSLVMLRWTTGHGSLHELNPTCPHTGGADIFAPNRVTAFTPEALLLLEQFVMTKITAMHHCGSAALGLNWENGLRHLLTAVTAAGAGAALLAKSTGRSEVDIVIMRHILSYIDTSFRLSPAFRTRQYINAISRLCRPSCCAAIMKTIFGNNPPKPAK